MRAEASLAAWAYNLRRALAVLGVERLLAAVKKLAGHAGSPGARARDPLRALGIHHPLWPDWIWPRTRRRRAKPSGMVSPHLFFTQALNAALRAPSHLADPRGYRTHELLDTPHRRA